MEWFKIEWKGTYPTETAQKRIESEGIGVYAIYETRGKSLLKLLYIGETYKQTFGTRLKQHKRDWLDNIKVNTVTCFGVVCLPEGKRLSSQRVLDVEKYLIHSHRPPFNTISKQGYNGREIMLINTGKTGKLETVLADRELLSLLRKYLA
ncbi:MAG: GIY-YIG nuclease family protein [Chloroflexi bacterium]|nr:GIY-YIG nuclease family protein [Chloroflexota bacterium]